MRALIFANGAAPDRTTAARWAADAELIIAADGGTRHALAIGRLPHVVIGDLDSLAEADRAQLDRSGVPLIVYPMHKDYTDLELAMRYALDQHATEIVICSALGGRWDQSLANIMLLTQPELAHVPTRIIDQHLTIQVIREQAEIAGRAGDGLSLIALQGDAQAASSAAINTNTIVFIIHLLWLVAYAAPAPVPRSRSRAPHLHAKHY